MSAPTMSMFATRLDCLEARDEYHVKRITELERQNAELLNALRRIARWHGEFPATGMYWESGEPMSYSSCYGSNGERDYMRQVALNAISAAAPHQQSEKEGE